MAVPLVCLISSQGCPAARRAGSTELQRSVDYRSLYADGHALFQVGRCAESLELLSLATRDSLTALLDFYDYERKE